MKKWFKFLGLFLLSIIWLISFSNAWSLTYDFIIPSWTYNWNVKLFWWPLPLQDLSLWFNLKCVFTWIDWTYTDWNKSFSLDVDKFVLNSKNYSSVSLKSVSFSSFFSNTTYTLERDYNYSAWNYNYYSTFYLTDPYQGSFTLNSNLYITCTISWDNVIWGSCPECEICPEVDTWSILSWYVAVSDIDMSYCVSNDLCPEMSWGYSALYINDIRHESMPFINITIPEEFNWDYSYTGNNTQFDLNVIGYNTDPDYIAWIINTQSTKPNSTDFNNIVSGLIPLLIPWLVIILFVWFIFKFIKKIF